MVPLLMVNVPSSVTLAAVIFPTTGSVSRRPVRERWEYAAKRWSMRHCRALPGCIWRAAANKTLTALVMKHTTAYPAPSGTTATARTDCLY